MFRKFGAELIGTFWLVLGGCGSAIFAAHEIGVLGVSLAFGLTVVTMAYAIAPISGCHLNPAVSFGLWIAGRLGFRDLVPYVLAQLIGAVMAGGTLYLVASGKAGFDALNGFAANGFDAGSPDGYSLQAAIIVETLLTAFFLFIIMGATDSNAPRGFAPLAIGLALTLIHLISIPIDNTSVNPARSLGVALFADTLLMKQLWVFVVAPLFGAMLGVLAYLAIRSRD